MLERLRDEGLLERDLLIHVETAGLQAHYADLGFDFPICMGPLAIAAPGPAPRTPGRAARVVYIGEAREEKGYERLPEIVAAIQAAHDGPLEFLLQSYSNVSNATPAIAAAKAELARMNGHPDPIALPEELDHDAFLAAIDSADVILMPYDARAYRTRGSGVVYDAISRRVPVVCTPGTDMIGTFAGMGVFSPEADTAAAFGACVAEVLGGEVPFPDAAISRFGIDNFIATLTGLHDPAPRPAAPAEPAPLVCYIPALPVDGGHGFVQRAHLVMLSQMEASTVVLGLPWANIIDGLAYFKRDTVVRYFDDPVWRSKPLYFVGLNDTESFRRIFARYHRRDVELFHHDAFEALVRDYITLGPVFTAFLALRHPDRVVANYTWMAPLAQRLQDLTGARTVCEVHDFQTQQNVFRRQSRAAAAALSAATDPDAAPVTETVFDRGFAAEAAAEARTLHDFDERVFISRTLQEDLARHGGPEGAVIYPPNATLPAPETFNLDRDDLLDGDHLAELDLSRLAPNMADPGRSHAIDVVFVGTAHAANITSLRFFLDDVLPLLPQERRINIFIVGNIEQGFTPEQKDALAARHVFFMGRVTSVTDWYLAAKVVLLPVIEGTGFPTKVIEALSLGQCFSAMAGAFYELAGQIGDDFAVARDAGEMAADIAHLLADPQARAARGAAGQAFYRRIFGFGDYLDRWGRVLDLPVAGTVDQPAPSHVESGTAVDWLIRLAALPLDGTAVFLGPRTTGLGGDWSHPEPEFRWIDGTTAHVTFRAVDGPARVSGVFLGLRLGQARGPVTVLADGVFVGRFAAGTEFAVHYLPFRAAHVVADVMTLTLIVPLAPQAGEDTRNLSALFSYIRVQTDPEDTPQDPEIPVRMAAPGRLRWWSDHGSEGPYPDLGLPNRFRWIGQRGLHIDYSLDADQATEGTPVFVQIDGFTALPHQSLVALSGARVLARMSLPGGRDSRVPFTRLLPLGEGTLTLRPTRTLRFPAPDGRDAGFAVTGLRVFRATGHGILAPRAYIGNIVIRADA